MSGIQKDLGPKGFEVLEGTVDEDAKIPEFVRQFKPPFPVGKANPLGAMEYLQMSPTVRAFVPFIVFIDRKGIIRAQFTGADKELADDQQEKSLRAEVVKLLADGAAPVKAKPKHASR